MSPVYVDYGNKFAGAIAVSACATGIGFSLTWVWVAKRGLPRDPDRLCTAQAVFIQAGDLASAFSSLSIGLFVFCIFVLSYTPSNRSVYLSLVFLWTVVSIMTFIGPLTLSTPSSPFYGNSGAWCWIASSHQKWRMWLHYFWVFFVAGTNLILYSFIAFKIVKRRRSLISMNRASSKISTSATFNKNGIVDSKRLSEVALGGSIRVASVMLIYPFVYILTILPISIYRVSLLNNRHPPISFALSAGSIFTLSGFVNCIVYAITRNIVSLDNFKRKENVSTVGYVGHRLTNTNPPMTRISHSRFGTLTEENRQSQSFGLNRSIGTEEIRTNRFSSQFEGEEEEEEEEEEGEEEDRDMGRGENQVESGITLVDQLSERGIRAGKDDFENRRRTSSSATTQISFGHDERVHERDEEDERTVSSR